MLTHGVKVQKSKSMVLAKDSSYLTPGRKWADKQHLQERSVGSLALQNSCLLYKQAHSL